jgi:hypothetical protein
MKEENTHCVCDLGAKPPGLKGKTQQETLLLPDLGERLLASQRKLKAK